MDGPALAFALACSSGEPAVRIGRCSALWPPRPSTNRAGATMGRREIRAQNALVVAQVAMAFVLLVAPD